MAKLRNEKQNPQFHPAAAGEEEVLSSYPKCLLLYKHGLNYRIKFKAPGPLSPEDAPSASSHIPQQSHSHESPAHISGWLLFQNKPGGDAHTALEMLASHPASPQILFFSWDQRNFLLPKAAHVWLSPAPTISLSKEMQAPAEMPQPHK